MISKSHAKRATDVAIAGLTLLPAAVPLLFAAVAVGVTMGRPVIYKQPRYGLNRQIFHIYKLRTMTDERNADGNLLPDIDRATRVGRFLRRTAIDELPQLFNILRGDMSVVGPRPMIKEFPVPGFERRYDAKPGLATLAKIKNQNGTPEGKLACDLEQIEKSNFWYDLNILFKNAVVAFTGRNDKTLRAERRQMTSRDRSAQTSP